jgi:hypothetical protein
MHKRSCLKREENLPFLLKADFCFVNLKLLVQTLLLGCNKQRVYAEAVRDKLFQIKSQLFYVVWKTLSIVLIKEISSLQLLCTLV